MDKSLERIITITKEEQEEIVRLINKHSECPVDIEECVSPTYWSITITETSIGDSLTFKCDTCSESVLVLGEDNPRHNW